MKKTMTVMAILAFVAMAPLGVYAQAKKVVVVYYSTNPNDKLVAEKVAAAKSADVIAIEVEKPYDAKALADKGKFFDAQKADRAKKALPAIKPVADVSKYETVFIGTEIWGGNASSPVVAFINANGKQLAGKNVAYYGTTTMEGGDAYAKDMDALIKPLKAKPIATKAISVFRAADAKAIAADKTIDAWLASIK